MTLTLLVVDWVIVLEVYQPSVILHQLIFLVVDRLEHGAPAFGAATPTTATWRRNVVDWHPDQGGDSRLWLRRNAAYQLLVAWYEFNRAS